MLYIWLFYMNALISAFTFGGGYIVIPMIEKYVVTKKAYLTHDDIMEMAAIAQSSPGAIAVNISALVGYRIKGIKGALVSCFGAILPPLIIISLLTLCYHQVQNNELLRAILKGMELGAAALIVDLLITMTYNFYHELPLRIFCLMPLTCMLYLVFQLPILVVITIGILWSIYLTRKAHI